MPPPVIAAVVVGVVMLALIVWRLVASRPPAEPRDGKSREEIIALIERRGYTVEAMHYEDGVWVAETKDQGENDVEIAVHPVTGKFVRFEQD